MCRQSLLLCYFFMPAFDAMKVVTTFYPDAKLLAVLVVLLR